MFAGAMCATGVSLLQPGTTAAATSSTLNFQARLESSGGAIASDGNYDVTFHLFSSATAVGGTSTDTGCGTDTSCEWVEQYTYNSGSGGTDARIRVVNGYLTVNLGSITAFSGVNWNQQQWLTMDIGGTTGSGTITWDGQMSPRLLLTATPYAFTAGQLSVTSGSNTDNLVMTAPASSSHTVTVPDETGTICTTAGSTACTSVYAPASGGSNYIQLQGSTPGAAQTGNFNISGTGIAGTLQAATVDTASSAALAIGTSNATQINLNQNTVVATGKTLQVKGHGSFGGNASPNSSYVLTVDETINPTGNSYGLEDILRLNPTASDGNFHAGIFGQAQTLNGNAQNLTGGIRGVTFFAQHNGTGTLNQGWGANFYVQNTSTGTITDAEGLAISSASNSGGGAITTDYGIKVSDQTVGATNYALYTGLGAVRLGDNTTIVANKSFTANGAATFTDATNSTTAFQVQNASSQRVLSVDTTNGKINLGAGSTLSGNLVFNNATNNNTITLTTGATVGSYSLTLPTATPAAGLCLQTSTASASQLVFASCANTNASITEVQEWDNVSSTTLSDSPTNLGDVIVLSTQVPAGGVTMSGVSGGGVSTWTKVAANNGNGTVNRVEIWMGTVTTTGAGTITVTYSGAQGANEVTATEFTASGVTANTTWGVDMSGNQLNTTSSTTVTYPSLISEGNAEVYYGYAQVQNSPGTAGSTSGFSYIVTNTQKNVIAYATPTVSNVAYQPTANQNASGQSNTLGVILTAFINSTAINNSTSLQGANFYVQAASSGSVAGILQANASGSGDILDLRNGSAANVMSVSNTGSVIHQTTTNSATAFQVQNASSANLFTVDTSNTAIILGNDATPSALTIRGGAATGTNVTGANLTFAASNGTGTGGSGDFIFQTAAASISTPTDDGNDNTSNASSTSSLTFSHTVTSNANRIIVVGIGTGCGFGSSCAATVSSVKYAGINLAKLGNADCTTGAGHCHVELWYLAGSSVATGANNVAITTSGSTTIEAGASSYYNVDPTTPFGTAATATNNNNPSTLTVTSNTTQLVVDVITSDNVINAPSAGQTQRYLGTGPIASSTKPGGASTTSMGWTDGASSYATIGAGLNPPAGSSSDSLQDRLHITASGNVGINTASPQYTLDVAGTARIQTTANSTTGFQVQSSSGGTVFDVDTTNGRVGIGTSAPGATLDLGSGTIQGAGLSSDCSSTNSILQWNSSTKQFSCATSGWTEKQKSSDTTATGSLQSDTDLAFSAAANSVYYVEVSGIWTGTASSSPQIVGGLSGPSGFTVTGEFESQQSDTAAPGSLGRCPLNSGQTSCTVSVNASQNPNLGYPFHVFAVVQTSSTSGTIAFQFKVANGQTVVIKKDSILTYQVYPNAADYAEVYYSKDLSIGAGDVVRIDGSLTAGIRKSSQPYDNALIGVVSTKPAYLIGDVGDGSGTPVPLALAGRVPIKVTTINGPIEPGDYLTSSNIPGVAMKATQPGQTIGKAMTSYTNSDPSAIGLVTVFVNPTWADPTMTGLWQVNSTIQNQINQSPQSTNSVQSTSNPLTQSQTFKGTSMSQITIQDANGSSLFTADTQNMVITIANLMVSGTLTINGHIITDGITPHVSAACDSAIATVEGTDTAGIMTFTPTSGCTTINGPLLTVTFNKPYAAAPHITITAANMNSASLQIFINSDTASATNFELDTIKNILLTANTTYKWYYQVIQ